MYRDSSLEWDINFLLGGGKNTRLFCTVEDLALWEGRPTLSPNWREYSSRSLRNPVAINLSRKEKSDRVTLTCPFKYFDALGKYEFDLDGEVYRAGVLVPSSIFIKDWKPYKGSFTSYDIYPADLAGLSKILYCATVRPSRLKIR